LRFEINWYYIYLSLKTHNFSKLKSKISEKEYLKILVLRTVGNFLIFSSLFFIGKTFYQPVREEIRYFVDRKIQKKYIVADTQNNQGIVRDYSSSAPKNGLAKMFNLKTVEVLVPQDTDYGIVIPKIGANAKIIANVNSATESDYLKALQQGVAHAAGTAYPGESGHIFLFAHSTDYIWNVGSYNAVFYLLYKLELGDEIDLFYQGQRYVYRVTDKTIVNPSEVEYLTRKTNEELLTLQTCWPPGTTLQRLLVFAKREAE